jgi:branched-chain amino acid aminotransferase
MQGVGNFVSVVGRRVSGDITKSVQVSARNFSGKLGGGDVVAPFRRESIEVVRAGDMTILPPAVRAPIDFNKLGFSLNSGPYMVVATETKSGWGPLHVVPSGEVLFDPMATVFHYGSAAFEGQQVKLDKDDIPRIWDPVANAKRFASSCTKLGITPMAVDGFVAANKQLVTVNKSMIPLSTQGSLYLRFFVVGSGAGIGVKPSSEHRLFGIVNPVGSYFPGGLRAISLRASGAYPRAAAIGSGAFKVGGNYANSFLASEGAKKLGFDEELYLRADRNTIDEAGAANFVLAVSTNNGTTLLSPAGQSVLPGTTLGRVLRLGLDSGYSIQKRDITLTEIRGLIAEGKSVEAFCTGTAAGIAPIGRISDVVHGDELVFNEGKVGPVAAGLYAKVASVLNGGSSFSDEMTQTIPSAFRTSEEILRDQDLMSKPWLYPSQHEA